jgi:tryptophan 2,3-dioxygenase
MEFINPLNAELNPICHLLALLGAHHILRVSRIRVKSNNHTNIVQANVPIQYDLPYYLQVSEGIRSYNKQLLEIIKEHKQVALLEIDIERKYYT